MQPVIVEIFGFSLRYYSLMYILAAFSGFLIMKKLVRERQLGIPTEKILDMVSFAFIGGIIGSRVYYVAFNWEYYAGDLLAMVAVWQGGLAIHGGLIGGAMAAWWYGKRQKFDLWHIADIAGLCVLLGQAFGRFGNFMNGDAHGIPTAMPWGVVFPPGSIAGNEFPGIPIHPVMLYEMLLNLFVFTVLFALRRHLVKGELFGWYLISYALIRSFTSTFRADDLLLAGIAVPYLASAIMFVLGAWIIWVRRKAYYG
ncbi:prolipoprotein diacylglyceryl transferase [Desulfurispirillum indicum]|uniref:Phosphatidylglycerol--prolipoprotein diacylglyceryl transferase n=1 Tax=Desulfurispirillum indicum (strain ATCC BAA-1389 / DSM 22839 / S5) TaxID=653733 RepID=E6W1Y4_DESIS|nr:prolipoprotein diacylglyceryl transferase [Desulfurispirillum indicum]ADU66610.1 prolipoprotein diacylglyceryl transferase [Desulfurispirillum indicum S5]UCZ55928.1 prolipoprotein diacylglyceryl transferase [Desulfurispirillum indicum]